MIYYVIYYVNGQYIYTYNFIISIATCHAGTMLAMLIICTGHCGVDLSD